MSNAVRQADDADIYDKIRYKIVIRFMMGLTSKATERNTALGILTDEPNKILFQRKSYTSALSAFRHLTVYGTQKTQIFMINYDLYFISSEKGKGVIVQF